jgi:hypothetical protein
MQRRATSQGEGTVVMIKRSVYTTETRGLNTQFGVSIPGPVVPPVQTIAFTMEWAHLGAR